MSIAPTDEVDTATLVSLAATFVPPISSSAPPLPAPAGYSLRDAPAVLAARGVRCSEDQLYRACVALFPDGQPRYGRRLNDEHIEMLVVVLPLMRVARLQFNHVSFIGAAAEQLGIEPMTMFKTLLQQTLVSLGALPQSA